MSHRLLWISIKQSPLLKNSWDISSIILIIYSKHEIIDLFALFFRKWILSTYMYKNYIKRFWLKPWFIQQPFNIDESYLFWYCLIASCIVSCKLGSCHQCWNFSIISLGVVMFSGKLISFIPSNKSPKWLFSPSKFFIKR